MCQGHYWSRVNVLLRRTRNLRISQIMHTRPFGSTLLSNHTVQDSSTQVRFTVGVHQQQQRTGLSYFNISTAFSSFASELYVSTRANLDQAKEEIKKNNSLPTVPLHNLTSCAMGMPSEFLRLFAPIGLCHPEHTKTTIKAQISPLNCDL